MQIAGQNINMDPFQQFFNKMNKDLASWLNNQEKIRELRDDYKDTLIFLEDSFDSKKLMVQVGAECRVKAKRINEKIIIRCSDELFVEFSRQEAIPIVKSLIEFNEDRLKICKGEIAKIMASIRDMENLIVSYQSLI